SVECLVLIGVVEGVSPSLEEASQTLRAGRWHTFGRVSLPLMRPGLANAFLVGFIESIADFGNPIVLGGNFGVLSTEVFFSIVGAQLDQGRAAALGVLLLALALAAFFVQRCSVEWGGGVISWAGSAWRSFRTTLELASIAAPLTAALGILTAYLLVRQRFVGRAVFEFATMLSFAIPGTVIGVSYILAY